MLEPQEPIQWTLEYAIFCIALVSYGIYRMWKHTMLEDEENLRRRK